jgi:hypothetical protein
LNCGTPEGTSGHCFPSLVKYGITEGSEGGFVYLGLRPAPNGSHSQVSFKESTPASRSCDLFSEGPQKHHPHILGLDEFNGRAPGSHRGLWAAFDFVFLLSFCCAVDHWAFLQPVYCDYFVACLGMREQFLWWPYESLRGLPCCPLAYLILPLSGCGTFLFGAVVVRCCCCLLSCRGSWLIAVLFTKQAGS